MKNKTMNHAASSVLHILAQNASGTRGFGKNQAKPAVNAPVGFTGLGFPPMKMCSRLLTPTASAPKLLLYS
jgi:hypothetical protein